MCDSSDRMIASAVDFDGLTFIPRRERHVSVMESSEGKNVQVAIRVMDERPSKSLGHRGSAYGKAAEITSLEEIAVIVQREVANGLRKKGFTTADYSHEASPRMTIEIRLLEYSTSTGFWTGGVHIKGALKVQATNAGKSYEKFYRSEKEERVVVVPTAETNEKWINDALSDLLTQLLEDNALIQFLSGKS